MEFDEIFEGDKNKMIALSVCRAADPEVLEPILRIIKEKGVRCHLVDDKEKLEAMLVSYEADHLIDNQIVIHHAEDDRAAATTALTLISTSQANVLMKGLISTAILLKEVLNKQHGMINDNLLSHVALFNIPNYHKAILLSDAGMNIAPSVEDKKKIIDNTLECAIHLSARRPKVGLLAAVEKVSDKMSATADADVLARMDPKSFKHDCIVEGPLQYDLAISKAAADHKGIQSDVAGDVDIIIAPAIEAGNILYKSLVYSAGASVASIIMGATVPIVLTSRADSAEDRYNSINLAMKVSK